MTALDEGLACEAAMRGDEAPIERIAGEAGELTKELPIPAAAVWPIARARLRAVMSGP